MHVASQAYILRQWSLVFFSSSFCPSSSLNFFPSFLMWWSLWSTLQMAENFSVFLRHGKGAVTPLFGKAWMHLRAWTFLPRDRRAGNSLKTFFTLIPTHVSKKNSFMLSFSHQQCVTLFWVKNPRWLVSYLLLSNCPIFTCFKRKYEIPVHNTKTVVIRGKQLWKS